MDPGAQAREKRAVAGTPPASGGPWRRATGDGLIRVREYNCTACTGDPPQAEQFERASISIVHTGVFGIRTGKRPQILSSGFLLIGNAGQNYEASHEHGVGDRCLVFEFGDGVVEDLAEVLRSGAAGRPFAMNVLPPHPRADALCRLAQEELSADGAARLEEIGFALAAHVLERSGAPSARAISDVPDNRRARDHVVAAIAHIERASTCDLGLSELAAMAGLSPFHFLRLFKRETGVTPHRFLVQTRIRRAVELLRDTSRPITDIAFDVGFADLSNFINAFRREIGCSPRHYRQSGLRHALPSRA